MVLTYMTCIIDATRMLMFYVHCIHNMASFYNHSQRRQSGLKSEGSWTRVKFDFREISEKFRFFQKYFLKNSVFQANFQKNSICSSKFSQNFYFSGNFKKLRFPRQKLLICSYFWPNNIIILFLFKSHHTYCT